MVDNPFFQLPPLSSAETPRIIQQSIGAGSAWQSQSETEPREEDTASDFTFPLDVYESAQLKVSIRPGFVNSIVPTIGGAPITNTPAPQLTVTNNATNYIILQGTYAPSTFSLGASFVALGSFGTLSAVTFTVSATLPTGETYPTVSGTSATNGTFKAVFATVVAASNVLTITQMGLGNALVLFMPPNRYIVFRNTHANAS